MQRILGVNGNSGRRTDIEDRDRRCLEPEAKSCLSKVLCYCLDLFSDYLHVIHIA